MHYRLYQPGDFDLLYAIEEICFKPPERFTRRFMRRLTDSSSTAVWIAEDQSKMAGFAILEWAQQISGIVAYIATIEVLPEFRGRGIGASLMHHLEESAIAQCAVAIWLHVDAKNASAIRLYERMGYRRSGRSDHFYARNRPADIYVKHLISES